MVGVFAFNKAICNMETERLDSRYNRYMPEGRVRIILSFAVIAAIAAVSTASILIRFAQEDAPSLAIAALRLTIATLILFPIAVARYRAELKNLTRSEIIPAIVSGLFLAAHFAAWITSLEYTTVANSVVLVATGPLWIALLSPLLLNERLTRSAILGLMIATVGGAMIGLADACIWDRGLRCPELSQLLQARAGWGNCLALAGAWAVSGYLIIGRKLRIRMPLVPYIFLVYGIAAVALNITLLITGQTLLGYPAKAYGWILLLAIFPQLIGHSTFNWALRYLPAALVAVTTLGEPIGSAILAFLLLHETPGRVVVIGGFLILIGIYLASQNERITRSVEES